MFEEKNYSLISSLAMHGAALCQQTQYFKIPMMTTVAPIEKTSGWKNVAGSHASNLWSISNPSGTGTVGEN